MPGFITPEVVLEGKARHRAIRVGAVIKKLESAYLALNDGIGMMRNGGPDYAWAAEPAEKCRSQISKIITDMRLQIKD